jgi:hypothetical protein
VAGRAPIVHGGPWTLSCVFHVCLVYNWSFTVAPPQFSCDVRATESFLLSFSPIVPECGGSHRAMVTMTDGLKPESTQVAYLPFVTCFSFLIIPMDNSYCYAMSKYKYQ